MLALIAGQGALPLIIKDNMPDEILVAALNGFPPEGLSVDQSFQIEKLGSFISGLSSNGVTKVCFAGSIRRPPLDPSAVDAATLPLVPRMMQAIHSGDDAALRTVIEFFEEAGISVVAVQELVPDLLPEAGVLSNRQPEERTETDANRGADIVGAMGAADIGQACVVRRRQAIAVEGQFGTNWMLESLVARPDEGGGILFKAPKPTQDRRIDLPTIGPDTIDAVTAAGLDGIVIEAGGVLIVNKEETVEAANRNHIFLWVRPA